MNENIKNLIPQFIKSLEEKRRSPATILAYKADLEQLASFLEQEGRSVISDIRQVDIEKFRDTLLEQKFTAKTVSRKLNAIKTFFRYLKSQQLIMVDNSKDVGHPKIDSSLPKFLSPIEYRALRDIVRADARIAAMIELILQTGLRISEVANLKIHHVKTEKVYIEAYATQPEREIPLNRAAKEAIEAYLKERPFQQAEHLFISKNGNPLAIRNIRASVDRYMAKAGIKGFSINDLRNTFVVENLRRGVDITIISQYAGHKRLSTTERYMILAEIRETGKKQEIEEL